MGGVCLCMSVTSVYSIETAEQIQLFSAQKLYRQLILQYVKRELGYLRNDGISLWKFVSNSELRGISPYQIDRRKFCQLHSTDDHRQFIILSVYLCVLYNAMVVMLRVSRFCLRLANMDRVRLQCTVCTVMHDSIGRFWQHDWQHTASNNYILH